MSIAGQADVFNVEPYVPPKKNDEVQDQIVAGNIHVRRAMSCRRDRLPRVAGVQGFPTDPTQYPW